jgi:hypothetical protein
MKIKIFIHQLGIAEIKINDDGTAIFHHKIYASYKGARRALTAFYGFAYENK